MAPQYINTQTLDAINAEAHRQELLRLTGKFKRSCYTGEQGHNTNVCLEEFGEVARAYNDNDLDHAAVEILETATCFLQWYNGMTDATSREESTGLRKYRGYDEEITEHVARIYNQDALFCDLVLNHRLRFLQDETRRFITPAELGGYTEDEMWKFQQYFHDTILPALPTFTRMIGEYCISPWFFSETEEMCVGIRHHKGKQVAIFSIRIANLVDIGPVAASAHFIAFLRMQDDKRQVPAH